MATKVVEVPSTSQPKAQDWTKPAAMAIPKEGYLSLKNGRYGPLYPRTPACHGFTIIAKIKPGREDTIRAYGKTIENAIEKIPDALATLKLHYLRWVLFNIGNETYFMYQGIFDTDFDKYTEDAVALFKSLGVNTVFDLLASSERVPVRFSFPCRALGPGCRERVLSCEAAMYNEGSPAPAFVPHPHRALGSARAPSTIGFSARELSASTLQLCGAFV